MLDYIVMQMRKTNLEKGYLPVDGILVDFIGFVCIKLVAKLTSAREGLVLDFFDFGCTAG